ncbi:MAG: hypothetical protein WB760_19530 [Xanthobacteraceae bacterium]
MREQVGLRKRLGEVATAAGNPLDHSIHEADFLPMNQHAFELLSDATPEGLSALRKANQAYRTVPWPAPYNSTRHRLNKGDARDLSWIPDASVHLVVTSPPYWTLKEYAKNELQLGEIENYDRFLVELGPVFS